ncbi:MAG: hypothetical protein BWX70_03531 [Verrucomicrobia bacterium ADurb.Bin070]|nr:MAG: hypothetical protein BWX70_03531 [Verrucomicrobia bacterium ADurb.Bin070]
MRVIEDQRGIGELARDHVVGKTGDDNLMSGKSLRTGCEEGLDPDPPFGKNTLHAGGHVRRRQVEQPAAILQIGVQHRELFRGQRIPRPGDHQHLAVVREPTETGQRQRFQVKAAAVQLTCDIRKTMQVVVIVKPHFAMPLQPVDGRPLKRQRQTRDRRRADALPSENTQLTVAARVQFFTRPQRRTLRDHFVERHNQPTPLPLQQQRVLRDSQCRELTSASQVPPRVDIGDDDVGTGHAA